jgi:hypothetical protein
MFSGDLEPSLWMVIPQLEFLIKTLRDMSKWPRFAGLAYAIKAAVGVLEKYYNKMDSSPAYILNICKCTVIMMYPIYDGLS